MQIAVGSTNKVKVEAVKEALLDSHIFHDAEVISVYVDSEISDQPLSLQETIQGAKNRAKNTFRDCKYSFGIEGGLMPCDTKTGFLHITVCCIYDGENYFTGLSTGIEIPSEILKLVVDKKMSLGQACFHSGISTNASIGSAEGLIGILTKGKINRKDYCKQAVYTAVLQLENAQWYVTT